MLYRTHQSERLSEIGIGCYAMSGAYGKKEPEQFIPVLRQAYELGVTFFDTADIYGSAEEILGRAIAPFRDQVWIATKVGARADGKPDCSAGHVQSSCEESLRRLGTDVIDLFQIHFDDPHTPVEETVGALKQLQAAGKIRHYGVGHMSLSKIQAYLAKGKVFSALVELSAVARKAREGALPLCREHHVGIIAFSITGRGLLTGKIGPGHTFEEGDIRNLDPLFQRERFDSGLRVAERFRTLGTKYGKTSVEVAIAWTLAQPGVICALTGPSTLEHLKENLRASGWVLPPDELAELDEFLQQEDAWLREEQLRNVCTILEDALKSERAFADLIYVLETLVEQGLAAESDIMPLLYELLALRAQEGALGLQGMRALHGRLRERFLPVAGQGAV